MECDSLISDASFENDSLNESDSVFIVGGVEIRTQDAEFEKDDLISEKNDIEDFYDRVLLEEDYSARLRASISWVLQKAYGNNIPPDFTDPFYETDTGSWLIKPILVNALSSSEIYCHACSNIFPETVLQRHGHSAILHILSRKCIYVTDSDDVAVTETVLQKTAPFHVKGHLALINGFMMAYAAEMASVENIVQAVRRVTSFNASSELPSSVEDSIVFWINKICSASQFAGGHQVIQGETHQKVRIKSRTPVREPYPVIDNLSEDIGDGSSLACLISFYCPKYLKFTDICMKDNLGIADSLYNLRLVRTFCEKHLPSKCFHFTYEDLLYSTNKMRENIIVLLAELFYWFELNPASCVQRSGSKETEVEACNGLPAISSATKKTLSKTSTELPTDNRNVSTPTSSRGSRLPLLKKRQHEQQPQLRRSKDDSTGLRRPGSSKGARRSQSVSTPRDRGMVVEESVSVLAWEDRHNTNSSHYLQRLNNTESRDSRLLANVSIDSELHESFTDHVDLDFTPRSPRPGRQSNIHDPNHPDYMEVESVTSNSSRSRVSALPSNPTNEPERLTPARLKTAKERVSNHTKAEERGHGRKKVTSPTKPKKKSPFSSLSPAPDEMMGNPLSEDLSERNMDSLDNPADSFYINTDAAQGTEVASSYSVPDQVHTQHSARAAGIPVVDGLDDHRRFHSREGSVASSRSSGDFSDHESHKIHYDHKAREMEELKNSSPSGSFNGSTKPILVITDKLPPSSTSIIDRSKKPHTTNFAEIKRLKEAYGGVENSGYVYMQHGQDDSPSRSALKSAFHNKQQEAAKKTSFAQLPNETTWQQSAQRSSNQNQNNAMNADEASSNQPLATELMSLRMKLDEKRKEIERKKHRSDLQQQKMRQRMGKAAFLQVVSKHLPDKDGPESIAEEPESSHSQRLAADVRERLGQMSLPGQRSFGESSQSAEAQRPTTLVGDSPTKFSRDGIQNKIDPVKKKWFKEDEMSTSAQSLPERRDSGSDLRRDSYEEKSRSLTQSPVPAATHRAPSEGSEHSSHSRESNPSFEEYGGSLDRLNHSLTQLQGEIAHLSLQHEQQMRSGRTPTAESHSVPEQAQTLPRPSRHQQHQDGSRQYDSDEAASNQQASRGQWQMPAGPGRPQGYSSSKLEAAQEGLPDCYSQPTGETTPPMSTSYTDRRSSRSASLPREPSKDDYVDSPNSHTPPRSTDGEDDSSSATGEPPVEGFFVSFGEDTPKRAKPKLLNKEKRTKKGREESPAPSSRKQLEPTPPAPVEKTPPAPAPVPTPAPVPAPVQVPKDAPKGFVLDEPKTHSELEMQQKREKLQQLQAKRLVDAERKRVEKEAENAKKKEKERLKQEEAEKKKADEKSRRDQIFQQYLQRKKEQEDEENGIVRRPVKTRPKAENHSGSHGRSSRPRPKSMFVKAEDTPDSKNSSMDDLSTSGDSSAPRSTPRSLRLPTSRFGFGLSNNRMRKAVSCNTLNQNTPTGGATYRRPESPDLFKTSRKSSRHEDGDGYQATGSEYAGPKLFVKPSSKSNRNLIINAISHCCLAGIVNNDVKNKVLEELARSSAKHFIILFRDAGLQYRGVYTYEPETEEVFKLVGTGPRYLQNKSLEKYYKYNSGSKSFSEITSTKHLSVSIDAIVPISTVWKSSKPSAMRR